MVGGEVVGEGEGRRMSGARALYDDGFRRYSNAPHAGRPACGAKNTWGDGGDRKGETVEVILLYKFITYCFFNNLKTLTCGIFERGGVIASALFYKEGTVSSEEGPSRVSVSLHDRSPLAKIGPSLMAQQTQI